MGIIVRLLAALAENTTTSIDSIGQIEVEGLQGQVLWQETQPASQDMQHADVRYAEDEADVESLFEGR